MKSFYFNWPKNWPENSKSSEIIDSNESDDLEITEEINDIAPQKQSLSGSKLFVFITLNVLIWGGAYLYLRLASPVYTSTWGIIVLGSDNSKADVQLPGSGRASTSFDGSRAKVFEDARGDYIFIAESSKVIEKAAVIARIDKSDFGQPEITADDNRSIISFTQEANSPELAHRKALALYSAFNDYLKDLRETSLYRRKSQNNILLKTAREKVSLAQKRLEQYMKSSSFESDEQLKNLAQGIEELRRLRSDYSVQAKGLETRISDLESNSNFQASDASDAYKLQGDQVYQQQLTEYGRLKTEFTQSAAELSSQHPKTLQIKEELENAENSLIERSTILLGRANSIESLTKKAALIENPQVNVVYADLFKEGTVNRADREQLKSQNQQLVGEIIQMEARLQTLSSEKLIVDRLRQDLQVSEAVLASKVAKLDLNQEDIYSIYPPIQLVVEPTIPDEDSPISPSVRMVILTALAGSFILTMGLILLWYDKQKPQDTIPNMDTIPPETSANS